jgi:hypothetical protein
MRNWIFIGEMAVLSLFVADGLERGSENSMRIVLPCLTEDKNQVKVYFCISDDPCDILAKSTH